MIDLILPLKYDNMSDGTVTDASKMLNCPKLLQRSFGFCLSFVIHLFVVLLIHC